MSAHPESPIHALADLTGPDDPLVLLDVGCRWGIPDAWTAAPPGTLAVYAFDADAQECARLQATAPDGVTYVPAALFDREGGAGRLHITREPGCSSLFPPDPWVLERFPALALMEQVGVQDVTLRTLDGWAAETGVERADAIKLDAQGAELGILRGATGLLASVRTIETEVMFNPLYAGQPLFGDIDGFLRERGFRLWRLKHLVHYSPEPQPPSPARGDRQVFDDALVDFPAGGGQLTWGHAIYCAERMLAGEQDPAEALRDACAAELVGLHDLATPVRVRKEQHGH
jgi:FkbM family methyltransferase